MAWKETHKQATREKILASAAKLFAVKGFEGVGIDEVMQDAGLTRGAFYAHFSSKSKLYEESILNSAKRVRSRLLPDEGYCFSLSDIANSYLGQEHFRSLDMRCPLSSLITDVTQQDEVVREVYTRVFNGFVGRLVNETGISREDALQKAVLMVGGMAIARALTDESLSEELLEVCSASVATSGTFA
ncbi:TetR/AcrR family transcriptional regulator [Teredinibacter sp. KSP-S5-2]|uniref:TetR/AcrR family transcriptional regulator n=1 Tax=Teredinibacter sp. KSP-S5-2 TaxID=3034506 RepID=UPI0029346D0D|nr:TetR/AcrR family transcriptional regulator [Teredinibacter sp. KSP-S5-2]WNO08800.1 TetR/AcrR family transcriptional regulator [Teredinibacter sp. KSP-S5-2]